MDHFFLLTLLTILYLIVCGGAFAFSRHSLSLVVICVGLYFFSLYGAWAIILDKTGFESGFHYHYLEDKIFLISLDSIYSWVLGIYSIFICGVVAAFAYFSRRSKVRVAVSVVSVKTAALAWLAWLSFIGAVAIFYSDILSAISSGVSIYHFTRGVYGEVNSFFTLFSLLDRIALLASGIAVLSFFSGENPKVIRFEGGRASRYFSLVVFVFTIALCFLLGNKNEILYVSISLTLLYMANVGTRRIGVLLAGAVVALAVLTTIETLRGTSPSQYLEVLQESLASGGLNPLKLLRSNEAFAAHFSLYGVIEYSVPLTWGTSLVSLAASVVPRYFWPGRPPDIYDYYATMVGAKSGQGYTIHHATGWYLNFGLFGVLLGAILMGWVLAWSTNLGFQKATGKSRWGLAISHIVPFTAVGCVANLMRAGIEAYKGFFLEGVAIPVLVLGIAILKKKGAR